MLFSTVCGIDDKGAIIIVKCMTAYCVAQSFSTLCGIDDKGVIIVLKRITMYSITQLFSTVCGMIIAMLLK